MKKRASLASTGALLATLVILGCVSMMSPLSPLSTPTSIPTLASTGTPLVEITPTPLVPADWLLYVNEPLGYQFNYPPNVNVFEQGMVGMPGDVAIPEGMSMDEYWAYLEQTLPPNLCVGVSLDIGTLLIAPPYEPWGKFASPCGRTGVGAYTIVQVNETVWVDGQIRTATGMQVYDSQTGAFRDETFRISLENGYQVEYGGNWEGDASRYAQYLLNKQTLLQILSTLHWIR
jgi:hypothetical protein